MTETAIRNAERPPPDSLLTTLADYVLDFDAERRDARETARLCLMDALGCGVLALNYPACRRLLGPVVPGADLPGGARVPGTGFELDPVKAAFDVGTLIRWLDFNDTWLAAEWGHPSDNIGALLAVADYLDRGEAGVAPVLLTVGDLLTATIKAYEIQGVLALENAFNRVGLDHVVLVRVASAAVVAAMLGCTRDQIINAVSNAWLDGGALRTYRHAPNTGSRKSWAAGDACSRAVRLALIARTGEMGYPSALTAAVWGFEDALFGGKKIELARPLGSYVIENVLFKIAYPAEFHAQTAVEAAIELHAEVEPRLDRIRRIVIETQEAGVRIIDKTGPLANPADRDHCLQYMVAVGLLHGRLAADDYEDGTAADPRIDALRGKMEVRENEAFSRDYMDPDRRAIGNAVQIFFDDGSRTERVAIDYPIGHRRRRSEGIPMLLEKLDRNLRSRFDDSQCARILDACAELGSLESMPISEFVGLWVSRDGD